MVKHCKGGRFGSRHNIDHGGGSCGHEDRGRFPIWNRCSDNGDGSGDGIAAEQAGSHSEQIR